MAVFGIVKELPRLQPFDEATSLFIKRDVFERTIIGMHASNLQDLRSPYSDNFYEFDKIFRNLALLMAAVGCALLVISSVYAGSYVDVIWFLVFTGILLLPILGSVAYSWSMASQVELETERVTAIRVEVDKMKDEFSRDSLPRYEALLRLKQSTASNETLLQPEAQNS